MPIVYTIDITKLFVDYRHYTNYILSIKLINEDSISTDIKRLKKFTLVYDNNKKTMEFDTKYSKFNIDLTHIADIILVNKESDNHILITY
ncbi:MAG: hypothetical protein KAS12_05090 [Candidatus Aenigmarchaeota archaeon]|nr:hypothetical protein [Candidatus Aenigmarchaeota archaeon]